jgi:4-amino-4-deoxy-L-arabinose transferase-like glycosyltransferase
MINIYKKFTNLPVPLKLTLIFILAFVIRLSMNVIIKGLNSAQDSSMGADPIEYDLIAKSLASGKGYPLNAYRPPGVPFLLFPIYYFFGFNYAIVRIMFCLLGAVTCIITYFIGKRLFDERLGVLAGAILAIYPLHFYYSIHFMSEVPWAFLMGLAVWCVLLFEDKGRAVYGILTGILLGLSAYFKPQSLFYLPFYSILIFFIYFFKNKRKLAKLIFIPLIFMLLTIAPWTIRVYRSTGHIVLISPQGGNTFWMAHNEICFNNPKTIGGWSYFHQLPEYRDWTHLNNYDKDKEAYKYGFEFIKRHLKDMPMLEMMKLYRIITPFFESGNKMFNIVGGVSWAILFIFVFIGIITTLNNKKLIPLHATLLLLLFITLVFFGFIRYRDAFSPFLVIYASIGWFYFLTLFDKKKK